VTFVCCVRASPAGLVVYGAPLLAAPSKFQAQYSKDLGLAYPAGYPVKVEQFVIGEQGYMHDDSTAKDDQRQRDMRALREKSRATDVANKASLRGTIRVQTRHAHAHQILLGCLVSHQCLEAPRRHL